MKKWIILILLPFKLYPSVSIRNVSSRNVSINRLNQLYNTLKVPFSDIHDTAIDLADDFVLWNLQHGLGSINTTSYPDIIWAAQNGFLKVIQYLLAHNTLIDTIDIDQNTALLWAAKQKRFSVLKYLTENGANIHHVNNRGNTALGLAAAEDNNIPVVKYLIEHGSDINHANLNGNTPLMIATYSRNLDMVKYLIKKGANIHLINNAGNTALQVALNVRSSVIKQIYKPLMLLVPSFYDTFYLNTAPPTITYFYLKNLHKYNNVATFLIDYYKLKWEPIDPTIVPQQEPKISDLTTLADNLNTLEEDKKDEILDKDIKQFETNIRNYWIYPLQKAYWKWIADNEPHDLIKLLERALKNKVGLNIIYTHFTKPEDFILTIQNLIENTSLEEKNILQNLLDYGEETFDINQQAKKDDEKFWKKLRKEEQENPIFSKETINSLLKEFKKYD